MKGAKIIHTLGLICSAIVLGYGIYLSVITYLGIGAVTAAGQGAAAGVISAVLGGTIMLILFVLSLIFSFFALIPVTLKIFRVFGGGRALDVFSAVFCVFVTLATLVIALSVADAVYKSLSFVMFFIALSATVLAIIASKLD